MRREVRGWRMRLSACLQLEVRRGKGVNWETEYWAKVAKRWRGPKVAKPSKGQEMKRNQSMW